MINNLQGLIFSCDIDNKHQDNKNCDRHIDDTEIIHTEEFHAGVLFIDNWIDDIWGRVFPLFESVKIIVLSFLSHLF